NSCAIKYFVHAKCANDVSKLRKLRQYTTTQNFLSAQKWQSDKTVACSKFVYLRKRNGTGQLLEELFFAALTSSPCLQLHAPLAQPLGVFCKLLSVVLIDENCRTKMTNSHLKRD
ncbi:hypothetical protein Tsp_14012, partial [Trichinella spiralis]|uniref:hypothetical protein n=1 Tax=Trichinella spiralis TaxID=6334 RepID=UPI0001EFE0A4